MSIVLQFNSNKIKKKKIEQWSKTVASIKSLQFVCNNTVQWQLKTEVVNQNGYFYCTDLLARP